MLQGTVDRIWENERVDGSRYWVLSIGGERYTTWNAEMVKGVSAGDQVDFSFSTSGRFRNLVGLKRICSKGKSCGNTSRHIVRMNCLRTAASLLSDSTLLPEQKLQSCIALSRRLEDHVLELLPDLASTEGSSQPKGQAAGQPASKPGGSA